MIVLKILSVLFFSTLAVFAIFRLFRSVRFPNFAIKVAEFAFDVVSALYLLTTWQTEELDFMWEYNTYAAFVAALIYVTLVFLSFGYVVSQLT